MKFTRKENRPGARMHGGGRAPLLSRALALPYLITFLCNLLLFSFLMPTSPALAGGEVAPSFEWPARGEVTLPFRPSQGPYGSGGHAGIDISLPVGSEVRASAAGTVTFAGGTPLGLCVSVTHGGGFKTTYVSLGSVAVRGGQAVERGEALGKSDGLKDLSSASPHLHFGLFLNGMAIDPIPLLQGRLLDPRECLFLGPWEDSGAIRSYLERHDEGGFLQWLGRGVKSLGGMVAGAAKKAGIVVGRAFSKAWGWACRAARWVGKSFQSFYNRCIRPWFAPLCRAVAETARKVWSNRYVQALVAGLIAAAAVCLLVVGVALAFGASIMATVVAAAVGSVAAIGYALYYAFASGDSFSFSTCLLSSLAVGGAAAMSSLLFSFMAPVIGAGWSQLGWLGFGKAFLINGALDSLLYTGFGLATGRGISLAGVLSTFLLGGLMGGVGKLFMSGMLAGEGIQALAAGLISSGGSSISGEAVAAFAAYAWSYATRLGYKLTYTLFCGCCGFLADVIFRISTGGAPRILESALAFLGGMAAGGLSAFGKGKGLQGILARISGGKVKLSGDLAKAAVSKLFSRSIKEGFSALRRKLKRGKKGVRNELLWSEIGGDS